MRRTILSRIKETFTGPDYESDEKQGKDYVEIPKVDETEGKKIIVRPYHLEEFEDVKGILDDLRAGGTIALINIAPLKEKDIVELKRAISKLKKTADAIDGQLAGFGEEYLVATPAGVAIAKASTTAHKAPAGDSENVEEY